MHDNSLRWMAWFRDTLCGDLRDKRLIDVGSMDINGTYRAIFAGVAEYVGLDVGPGPGVDIVARDPYRYEFPDASFDLVISGQALEHMTRPWLAVNEMRRLVKPGGLVCCIAPWVWEIHRFPIDCFRILPDGMRSLMEDARLQVLHCFADGNDTVGVGTRIADAS